MNLNFITPKKIGSFVVVIVILITCHIWMASQGWSAIAARFSHSGEVPSQLIPQKRIELQNADQAPVHYNELAASAVTENGLFLSLPGIMKFRHPPLLIPWSAIKYSRRSAYWTCNKFDTELRLKEPDVTLTVSDGGELIHTMLTRYGVEDRTDPNAGCTDKK